MQDWTREYFERGYALRWGLNAPSADVRLQAGGLWELLQLSPTSRVIDIGCGHGRHALGLGERGAQVVGVDSAATLLNRARELAAELRVDVRWVRGDMRQLPFRSACANAAVIMDAFGFFDTDEENESVLHEAARVLKADGRLALKVVNGRPVLAAFREADVQERDGVVISISRALAIDPPRMTERISIKGPRGNAEYERRQRLYRVEELCAAAEHAGFGIAGVSASPEGGPFDAKASTVIWLVGERRGRDKREST